VPGLITRAGPVAVFRGVMLPMAVVALFPALARLAGSPGLMWPALAAAMAAKATLFSLAFSSIMIAINNSSRGVSLGAVNGLGQSVASFVRAAGPFFGGPLYSASLGFAALGSWRLHVCYVVMAAFALLAWVGSFRLPLWLNSAPDFGEGDSGGRGEGAGGKDGDGDGGAEDNGSDSDVGDGRSDNGGAPSSPAPLDIARSTSNRLTASPALQASEGMRWRGSSAADAETLDSLALLQRTPHVAGARAAGAVPQLAV
jgi:hypothetical protein